MKQQDVFGRLATELTRKERQDFLSGLLKEAQGAVEPVEYHIAYENPPAVEEELSQLSFLQRLFLWFDQVVSGKKGDVVFREQLLKRSARRLAAKNNSISKDRLFLTPQFRVELEELQRIARYFLDTVTQSMTHRTAFYAFMGRVTLDDHFHTLVKTIDPQRAAARIGSAEEFAVKEELDHSLDRLMNSIDLRRREVMQDNSRVLYMLQKFCSYNFEGFLSAFSSGPGGSSCEVSFAGKHLKRLSSILYSLDFSGEATLFESLYLFSYHADDRMDQVDRDEMQRWINGAYDMINRLSEITGRLSLRDLTACCLGEYLYQPERLGGGDDWFASYKKFWTIYKQDKVKQFITRVRFDQHLDECRRFLELERFPWLKYFGRGWKEAAGSYPPLSASLAFCSAAASMIKEKMGYSLKIVLGEGQFYKKQNYEEFLEAFELMMLTPERAATIDDKCFKFLASEHFQGELNSGGAHSPAATGAEAGAAAEAGEADQSAVSEADLLDDGQVESSTENGNGELSAEEQAADDDKLAFLPVTSSRELFRVADKSVRDFRQSISVSAAVMRGILFGEVGGRYDTLSNLAYLGGSRSQLFIDKLKGFMVEIDNVMELLDMLLDVENRL